MPVTRKQYQVVAESPAVGGRVDRVIQTLSGLSRAQVVGLFDHGCVTVNGTPCDVPGQPVAVGDLVELAYYPGQRYHAAPKGKRPPGFGIIYEDRQLIVVDKPASMLTVPAHPGEAFTLVDRLSDYLRRCGGARQAFTVHRLDRGVSGLLVFGKTAEWASRIRAQFAEHKPERLYFALVAGRVASNQGTWASRLTTDRSLRRHSTDDEEDDGEHAVTHFAIEQRWADASLARIWLETGRRNQIRVHFAEAGHPVIGDDRYRPRLAAHPRWPFGRLALHARALGLTHPATGEPLRWESPLPMEFDRFIAPPRSTARPDRPQS
jgi:23S rRNA pseudouridine1911/1915/1917 synthase